MTDPANKPTALRVSDVDKSYGRRKVLDGVSFDIDSGERVALMGPSGSGKSTLLNLIAGIDHADAGDIRIGGQSLGAMNGDELCHLRRKSVTTVFQFFHLLPTLTVRENIEFPLQLLGLSPEERRQRMEELVTEVQLTERADAFPDQLSGGEMQRVAIARALAPQPSLILADEPTGNLDSATGATILDLLEELSKKHDTALLLVTHHQEATRICRRTSRSARWSPQHSPFGAVKNASAKDPALSGLLWSRFTWRHWRRSARSTFLLVTILALGVAAMFSIRLANRAALDGFRYFSENLTGGSDLILRSPNGQLPVSALSDLRTATSGQPVGIFPILESTAALIEDLQGDSNANANAPLLRLTGVDFVALRNAIYLAAESPDDDATSQAIQFSGETQDGPQLGSASEAWVAASFAAQRELSIGDTLQLAIDDRIETIRIAGLLENDPTQPQVPENLVLFDLPGLQNLLARPASLTRVEIRVPAGADRDDQLDRVRSRISALAEKKSWLLETPDERMSSSQAMTAAFRLNLTVLSTLALLVGVYLILQALEAAVVRRRKEIAILRSLGVTATQIRRAWFFEALVLGIFGTLLGLVLGWGAAQLTVGNIAKTVSALYHETTTRAAGWHSGEALFAATFGIAASLVAGWLPARDAATTPPVQSLRGVERNGGPRLLRSPWLGVALIIFGWLFCQAPPLVTGAGGKVPLGGYLAALSWLTALSILCSVLFRPFGQWLSTRKNAGPSSRYAASQLRQPSGRHRLTAAGLVVAVGMAAGMGILVHSFEGTLSGWIRQMLKADLYVAPAGIGSASSEGTLSEVTWQSLSKDPEVAGVDVIRHYSITVDGRRTVLAGSEYADHERSLRLSWRQKPDDPDPDSLTKLTPEGHHPAWISESFAIRFDQQRGDFVEVPTPSGVQRVEITGVYIDYHNESGTVLVNRQFSAEWFGDDRAINSMAIFLKPDTDIDQVRERWTNEHPTLVIRTNTRLRNEALRVFHQTFAVTHALEAIGIAVAVAGLALTLASLMIERRGEVLTLKQLGMTRRQLAKATAVESVGIASVGTAVGLLLSLALGYVLIYVVNRQSFGWTLQFAVPWLTFVGLALVTLLTSATVGWFIGRNGTHLKAERQE